MILTWGRAKVITVIKNVIRLQCLSLSFSVAIKLNQSSI